MEIIRRIAVFVFTSALLLLCIALPRQARAVDMSSRAGIVSTAGGALNVRSSASASAAKVTSLGNGSYVTLIAQTGSWWKVEYASGSYGYCHGDYIKVVSGSPATVQTQSGGLNVRSGAGTSYAKVASLSKGQTVLVLSSSGGWSRILYNGTKTGYVSSQYLSGYYSAVSLWVPNLKQMDSRWADITIASSGKTFAQIGCATTAIAMVESHRTGKTIYPNVMASQLTYTASGNVYWPAHFTTITNEYGYLSTIYHLLKQGKPVLFGAKNAYGSQHWVVVTGYTGGSTITAANFTIQDPGSYYRTNLQQFLSAYPTFYKYFYY